MDKNAARDILWIRAIDQHDADREILSMEARARVAESTAFAGLEPDARRASQARALLEAVAERRPEFLDLDRRFRWPLWLLPTVLIGVFIAGVVADTLTSSGRIDIIAFPLLGLFLWNLAIYLFLSIRWILARRQKRPVAFSALSAWFPDKLFKILPWPDLPRTSGKKGLAEVWRAAARSFGSEWLKLERPRIQEQLRILAHSAAVAAVAGMAVNMYLKGLNFEYRAGWGSTFLTPESLRGWLGLFFNPASWLTGIPLPDAAALKELRWSNNPEGGDAADWIHLYAATAALVAAPRLALIALGATRWWRSGRDVQFEGLRGPLLQGWEEPEPSTEGLDRVCVVPYNHACPPTFKEKLRQRMFERAGERFHFDYLDRVNYGLEAEYAASLDVDRLRCRALAVVFNLSSTPEEEVQGMFLDRLEQMTRRSRRRIETEVWLDESAFSKRFGGDQGYAERLTHRRAAWSRLLAKRELRPEFIDVVNGESPQAGGEAEAPAGSAQA